MSSTRIVLLVAVLAIAVAGLSKLMVLPNTLELQPATEHPTETMTAIVYRQHGDVNQLEYTTTYPKPVPKPTQYLIKVEASALNPVDFKMRRNTNIPQFMIPLPKIPGGDMAGVVIQTPSSSASSKEATKFQVGDRVAAMMPIMSKWGSNAEYVAVEEKLLAKIGDHTSFIDAASYPLAGLTVLQNFANLQKIPSPGDKLLVHAGAGGVGTFAIQYAARELGMKVATTASAPKANLLKELGADIVVDYRTEQFENVLSDYDVVLDPMSWLYEERTLGNNVLKPTGHYLNVPSSDANFINGIENANGVQTYINAAIHRIRNLFRPGSTPRYGLVFCDPNGRDLQTVLDLMESGKVRSVIDRTYHISDAIEAYRYLEQGHATGKVVLVHSEEMKKKEQEEEAVTPIEGVSDEQQPMEQASDEEHVPEGQPTEKQPEEEINASEQTTTDEQMTAGESEVANDAPVEEVLAKAEEIPVHEDEVAKEPANAEELPDLETEDSRVREE